MCKLWRVQFREGVSRVLQGHSKTSSKNNCCEKKTCFSLAVLPWRGMEGKNRNDEDAHRRRRCFCERISSEVRRTFARKPNGSTDVRKNNPSGVFEGLKGWVSVIYIYYIHKHAQTCLKIFRTYHYAPYIKFILSGYVTSRTDASCTMNIDHWRHQWGPQGTFLWWLSQDVSLTTTHQLVRRWHNTWNARHAIGTR